MGVSQPRISHLVRGKIGVFTIDTLVNMATAAGLKADVAITAARPRAKSKRVA
jgi:predicted XRE-type DNA-binding protein